MNEMRMETWYPANGNDNLHTNYVTKPIAYLQLFWEYKDLTMILRGIHYDAIIRHDI